MLRSIQFTLLLTLSSTLIGCAATEPGSRARVAVGSDFPRHQTLRILLLPVEVEGKPGFVEDKAVTDGFAQHLISMGYKVIDWDQAVKQAGSSGSHDDKAIAVARSIGADAIAKGRVTMTYVPGRAEAGTKVETLTRTEIRNGTHRKDTVTIREDVPTSYSYSSEGSYYKSSQSISIIAVPSGEVWLSASVDSDSEYDMTDEIAAGMRRAFK
jgi:hypothetical protein